MVVEVEETSVGQKSSLATAVECTALLLKHDFRSPVPANILHIFKVGFDFTIRILDMKSTIHENIVMRIYKVVILHFPGKSLNAHTYTYTRFLVLSKSYINWF
jgi:hypothetical protein